MTKHIRTIDQYLIEIRSGWDTKMGDITKDIQESMENLMLPSGSYVYVVRRVQK